jgi:hypothetical protein
VKISGISSEKFLKKVILHYDRPFLFASKNCRAGARNGHVHREKKSASFFTLNPQIYYLELSVSFLTPTGLGNTGVLCRQEEKKLALAIVILSKNFKKEIT